MANLYEGKMAAIFDAMYQTFINYDEEYAFYNQLITENNATTVLEIGSGTGNLAKRFYENQQDYSGLDYSESMIAIAQKRNPNCVFIQGDMREFKLEKTVDAILITGRSTSYLESNTDINATFDTIYKNLNKEGILIFDFIDANRFIPFIKENHTVVHQAKHKETDYYRDSSWKTNTSENFMIEWTALYYTLKKGAKEILADDFSTLRIFTLNEIQLFLYLNGFEILKTIDRKTYAYDTYVIVAKKKPEY
jgi:SAM-dependent methyltransferase